jgi:hypothetical protein
VSEDPVSYSQCTLAELRDVASHIDRVAFPERARLVDEEIGRRERLPIHEQEPVTFVGGARWGESMYFGRTASWPFAKLTVSSSELVLEVSVLFFGEKFIFLPGQIKTIIDRPGIFGSSLVIEHNRRDYPPVIVFFPGRSGVVRQTLMKCRWPVAAS